MGEAPVDQRYRSHLEDGDVDVPAGRGLSSQKKKAPGRAIAGRGALDEECGTKHRLFSDVGEADILTPRRNSGSTG